VIYIYIIVIYRGKSEYPSLGPRSVQPTAPTSYPAAARAPRLGPRSPSAGNPSEDSFKTTPRTDDPNDCIHPPFPQNAPIVSSSIQRHPWLSHATSPTTCRSPPSYASVTTSPGPTSMVSMTGTTPTPSFSSGPTTPRHRRSGSRGTSSPQPAPSSASLGGSWARAAATRPPSCPRRLGPAAVATVVGVCALQELCAGVCSFVPPSTWGIFYLNSNDVARRVIPIRVYVYWMQKLW
jgi:hypothetical protein